MTILFIGGGSGGHLFPLFCVADALCAEHQFACSDVHFIIADNNADFEYFKNKPYQYTVFSVAKLRRYFSWENIRDVFRFIFNIGRAFFFLRKHRPQKIFSKGGFVSLPFGLAAALLKIPFYLHETDSVMGLSNGILERFSEKIFTGFPSKNPRHIFVGNPVRPEFFAPFEKQPHSRPHLFVFGGSQGSLVLNEWTRAFCQKFPHQAEVLLVTGKGKKKDVVIEGLTEKEFLHDDFIAAMQNADVIVARAGGSIAEMAAAKKCVILVPLPLSANNHQQKNAEAVAQKNAGLLVRESELFTEKTFKQVLALLKNRTLQEQMANNLSAFAFPDATQKIISHLL